MTSLQENFPTDPKAYRLLSPIGSGSFGTVYKAICIPTKQTIAIKVVDLESVEDDLTEIVAEINSLSECDSPYITRYLGSMITKAQLWILMEYMAGGSLRDVLRAKIPISEKTIAAFLLGITSGIHYLHSKGVIHRDVKAANVLLGAPSHVKLADFGVTAQLTETVSKRRTFVGTPYWMAPEVIEHKAYDQKADIWSLGITALELAHSDPPHSELHPMRALFVIPKSNPPTLRGDNWSSDFQAFVEACLVKDPEKRASTERLLKGSFLRKARMSVGRDGLLGVIRMSSLKIAKTQQRAREPSDSDSGSSNSYNANEEKNGKQKGKEDGWNFNDEETVRIRKEDKEKFRQDIEKEKKRAIKEKEENGGTVRARKKKESAAEGLEELKVTEEKRERETDDWGQLQDVIEYLMDKDEAKTRSVLDRFR